MAHVAYPASFPTECISDLISIVRDGMDELIKRKAEAGLHIWNIQGFAQSVLLGSPDGPFGALSDDDAAEANDNLVEFANAFQAQFPDRVSEADLAEVKTTEYSGAGAAKIDWKKWANFFVTVILPILISL